MFPKINISSGIYDWLPNEKTYVRILAWNNSIALRLYIAYFCFCCVYGVVSYAFISHLLGYDHMIVAHKECLRLLHSLSRQKKMHHCDIIAQTTDAYRYPYTFSAQDSRPVTRKFPCNKDPALIPDSEISCLRLLTKATPASPWLEKSARLPMRRPPPNPAAPPIAPGINDPVIPPTPRSPVPSVEIRPPLIAPPSNPVNPDPNKSPVPSAYVLAFSST
jgi:hypothetical protein